MIDTSVIGQHTARTTVQIERGRLRLFAKVLGQDDPVYSDLAAARAEGHPDLPVPPTFLMGLEVDGERRARLSLRVRQADGTSTTA